ncbi:TonB-dependent receptor [Cesiribacter sp. SM1]|uniref:TonB-dependent receptor n=1 Tax=Cesiribacter sp. SM1 TaxID=2861196 RepID=UPI001CD36B00|nr:TonB-dependent receptor [Cesiribacter sp. SM1]
MRQPIPLLARITFLALFFALVTFSEKGFSQQFSLAKSPAGALIVPQQNGAKEAEMSLTEALERLEKKYKVRFTYNPRLIKGLKVRSVDPADVGLEKALDMLFETHGLKYKKYSKPDNTYFIYSETHGEEGSSGTVVPVKAQEQAHRVTGTVTSPLEPAGLPGVSIVVKGTTIGTITDVDGKYALEVPSPEGVLIFSFVGFQTREIPINNQTIINVELAEDDKMLDEVVVVGYGTQMRSNVTGAVDQVTAEDLEGRPVVNLTEALQGTSPNLIIQKSNSEPGAGVNLNIRGISTLGNNSPLVVIDGIVGGDINMLNPADIETVSILKDAGSAAIYGSRANNGVILVTTKKGRLNNRPSVTYNGLAGVNSPHFFLEPVSGYQNAMLRNESAFNAGKESVIYTPEQIRQFQENGDEQWFIDEITQPAWQQNHNLSVSGGGENSSYYASGGYMNQRSNFVGPDKGLTRYNFRLNLTNQIGRFKLTTMLSYMRREVTDHSSSTSTLIVDAGRVPLIYAQKDSLGRYLTNDVLQQFNSLGILEKGGFRRYDDDNIFGSVSGELKLTDFLKVRGVFGANLYSNHQFGRTIQVDFFPKGVYGDNSNTYDESRKTLELNSQIMAEFNKTFNDEHNVTLLLGVSNENHADRGTGIYLINTDPDLGTPTSETEIEARSYTSNQSSSENSLNSAFGRASYSFNNKLFGEFNFRYDGSSKFSEKNRWGFFPSVSAGYRISEEAFLGSYRDNVGGVKLRASYGVLGNQNVDNYQYQTTFFSFQNAYGFNNVPVSGTGYNFANPELRWERAATFNVGADLDFFKGALTVSVDYFNKVTSDILLPPAVPGVFGTDLPDFNAAKVGSKGWEFIATYQHMGNLFSHNLSFNIADSQNEILELVGGRVLTNLEELQILRQEGYPYHSYVGLQRDGYFQSMEEIEGAAVPEGLTVQPGDNRYVDVVKDGVIDDKDKVVFGNPFPRYTYGFNYTVAAKGFDLGVLIQGVGKRTMMIRGETVEPFHYNYGMTMYTHQLDYWTPQNPDARYPRLADNGSHSNTNNFRRGSDMYLFDGAYLRVKNVQLGYTLPGRIASKAGMEKLRVYLSGQNLFTLAKVDFVDPELTEFNSNLEQSGANSARAYPTLIYYGFGLDVTF